MAPIYTAILQWTHGQEERTERIRATYPQIKDRKVEIADAVEAFTGTRPTVWMVKLS